MHNLYIHLCIYIYISININLRYAKITKLELLLALLLSSHATNWKKKFGKFNLQMKMR